MVDTDKLKGAIIAAGHRNLGKAGMLVGIKPMTFYRKLRTGNFTVNEVDDMIEAFFIRHPEEVFPYGRRTT